MKKKSNVMFFASLLAIISAAVVLLYVFKDHLKNCPFCKNLCPEKEDFDIMDEEFSFEEPEEELHEKEEKPAAKVRRGYIPIHFHK